MTILRVSVTGLVVAACLCLVCESADFVVAPDGDDGHPGTAEQPFATLLRARDAVREKVAAGLTADVTVLLRGGRYRVDRPVVFGPADGGTDGWAVTYAAWPGERPVISGGQVIRGWQVGDDGTWRVEVPQVKSGDLAFRQLFVGGRRAVRARQPNAGYFRVEQVGEDRRTNFRYKAGDVQAVADPAKAELVFLHDWSITRVPVKLIDPATRILTVQHHVGGSSRWAVMNWFEPHPRYFLENSPEFLDAPGEWYLDAVSGVLSYRPRCGERPDQTEVIAPVAAQLLVVRGDADRPVRNLHFAGLSCAHAGWAPPSSVYWGRQACTYWSVATPADGPPHAEADPAAVQFDLAKNCSFEEGRICHVGASGIWLGRGCRDCRVSGTVVADTGGNGVMIGEGQTRHVGDQPWWQAAPAQAASDNRVVNNMVTRCGQELFGAVGIWVGLASGTTVANNEVFQHPYTGVSLGWMWWNPRSRPEPRATPCRRTRVLDNHIHHCMLTLSDGGCIYSLGNQPESAIRGNLIHDIAANVGRAESNGMFLDQGTGSFVIEENVIYNVTRSPLRFHKGWTNLVRNNVFEVQSGVPPVRFNDTVQERIRLEDNRLVERIPDDVLAAYRRRAGPEAPYRDRLLRE